METRHHQKAIAGNSSSSEGHSWKLVIIRTPPMETRHQQNAVDETRHQQKADDGNSSPLEAFCDNSPSTRGDV